MAKIGPISQIEIPAMYDDLTPAQRLVVRRQYETNQQGNCHHCGSSLDTEPPERIKRMTLKMGNFPPGFFKNPVHLHHSHDTGLTIGAVHARCNAVLWQYYGE